jgi:hypothetical protein
MPEIYLTGVAGQEVPADGENNEQIGEGEGTKDKGVCGNKGDEEEDQNEN